MQKHLPEDAREHMHQLKGIVDYFQLDDFRSSFDALQKAVSAGEDEPGVAALIDELEELLRKSAVAASEPSPDQAADS